MLILVFFGIKPNVTRSNVDGGLNFSFEAAGLL